MRLTVDIEVITKAVNSLCNQIRFLPVCRNQNQSPCFGWLVFTVRLRNQHQNTYRNFLTLRVGFVIVVFVLIQELLINDFLA